MGCFRLIALYELTRLWNSHREDKILHHHVTTTIADSNNNMHWRNIVRHSRGWALCLERHLQCSRCTAPGPIASLHSYHTLTRELERRQSRGRDELLITLNLHNNSMRVAHIHYGW